MNQTARSVRDVCFRMSNVEIIFLVHVIALVNISLGFAVATCLGRGPLVSRSGIPVNERPNPSPPATNHDAPVHDSDAAGDVAAAAEMSPASESQVPEDPEPVGPSAMEVLDDIKSQLTGFDSELEPIDAAVQAAVASLATEALLDAAEQLAAAAGSYISKLNGEGERLKQCAATDLVERQNKAKGAIVTFSFGMNAVVRNLTKLEFAAEKAEEEASKLCSFNDKIRKVCRDTLTRIDPPVAADDAEPAEA